MVIRNHLLLLATIAAYSLIVGPANSVSADDRAPLLVAAPGSPFPFKGESLAAGDINGDGCSDLILVEKRRLLVFFGASHGLKDAPDKFVELGMDGNEMSLADFNRDGNMDIAMSDHDSYVVTVHLGQGNGEFTPAKGSPFKMREGNQPHTHGLTVADVNGDSFTDIITANKDHGDLSLLIGDGRGGFVIASHSPILCGASPYAIVAGDVNGDGLGDVLVPNNSNELKSVHVLLGNGQGKMTHAPDSPLTCMGTARFIAVGDLNDDKLLDLVAMHGSSGTGASMFINAGDARFTPASPLEIGHEVGSVEIADMNNDGKADLVVAADESIKLLLGDGKGGFAVASSSFFKTGKGAWRLIVADFNGDGRNDVATRCVEANQTEVFFGN